MQSTAHVREATWDSIAIHYEHTDEKKVVYIYIRRRGNAHYEPWLVRAPSALLARVGAHGMGLYAARRFKPEDVIGKYEGTVVNTYESREHALDSPLVHSVARHGANKLRLMRSPGGGWDVINGDGAPLPNLSLVNDPHGTRFHENVHVSEWGYMRATATIPPFDLTKTIEENIGSELKDSYGDEFWQIHSRLGTREVPLEV